MSLSVISTPSPFQTPTLKPWQYTHRDSAPPFAISQRLTKDAEREEDESDIFLSSLYI